MRAAVTGVVHGTPIEVWFMDEARVGQQGTLTRIWAKRGTRPARPPLHLDVSVRRGLPRARRGRAVVMPSVNVEAMSIHLAEISRGVSQGAHAVLVLDGAGWHTSPRLRVPENISLLPLPRYAPELNPVENLWAFLRANFLSHRVWESYDAIVDACCHAWTTLMRMPERVASITSRAWARVNV